jgi:Pyruvate/2-oxoacid:ferredoxin oxidoreductase delta subunit
MCEFCMQHGEGKKWYLQAKNYSDDLLSDIRRRKFIQEFFVDPSHLARDVEKLERLDRAPRFIRSMVRGMVSRRMKPIHYGQVVPIEEVEQILGFAGSVVRVACICRHVTLGKEKRYCYGISLAPDGGAFGEVIRGLSPSFLSGPDNRGLEVLTPAEAIAAIRGHEDEGLCHTVWTFVAPFIGGLCNCDRADCLAMRSTVSHAVPVMFRAEWVAAVDPSLCSGCRSCMRSCQFGAIGYSASEEKAVIDQHACYGCGICRTPCTKKAIRLEPRAAVPAAAGVW